MADVKPLTVDNMGIGTSSRYARDRAALQEKLIDGQGIPDRIAISTVSPQRPAEFEKFLSPTRTEWGSFSPPPDYLAQAHPLFTLGKVIPGVGSLEQRDQIESRPVPPEEEGKKQKVVKCLDMLNALDRDSTKVEACRNQFQRG